MPKTPVRSGFFLLLLGVILLTLALVVRSGIFARKNPGEPINSAMREAMEANGPELTTKESLLVEQLYPTAAVTASGLRYVVRRPGTRTDAASLDRWSPQTTPGGCSTGLPSTARTSAACRFPSASGQPA